MEHIGVHCFTSNHLENIVNKYRSDYPQGIPPPNKNLCFFHWPHFPYLSSAKDKAARRPSLSSSSVISSRLAWSVNERFQAITLSDRRTVSESSVTLPPRRNPQCQLAGTLSATDAKTANEKRPHATNPKRRRRIPCVPIRAFLSLWGREQCYHVLQNKVCETKDLTFKLCKKAFKIAANTKRLHSLWSKFTTPSSWRGRIQVSSYGSLREPAGMFTDVHNFAAESFSFTENKCRVDWRVFLHAWVFIPTTVPF